MSYQVLLVEDEENVADLVNVILQGQGFRTIVCSNGKQALEVYKEKWEQIDLVLLDMRMPEMNGKEAFTHMKKINANIWAILLSGYSDDDDVIQMTKDGIKAYVKKPFRKNELVKVLNSVLHE